MKARSRFILAGTILAALHAHATPIYWTGDNGSNFDTGSANSNWSTDAAGTTDYALGVQTGDALNFAANGVVAGLILAINNNQSGLSVGSLTFLPAGGSFAGPLALSGNAFTLTGGLTNNNTTASRNVTIGNAITVSGNQTWTATNSANAITILNGNLDGSGNITLGAGFSSNSTTLPTIRLGGSNSAYTGTITTTGATSEGILLLSSTAQTGGLVDLSLGNRNLWLTGGAGTYTFGITNSTSTAGTTTGARVAFRGAGTAGLYLTGGDVTWDPGSGSTPAALCRRSVRCDPETAAASFVPNCCHPSLRRPAGNRPA